MANTDVESNILTINLRNNIVEYLEEIEKLSGIKMSDNQRKDLINYVATTEFSKDKYSEKSRTEFNEKLKELRDGWIEDYGKKNGYEDWPKSEYNLFTAYDVKKIAYFFTTHHIIKIEVGGANEKFNMYPLELLGHNFLHEAHSNVCYKIFEQDVKIYSFADAKARIDNIAKNLDEKGFRDRIDRDYKIMKDLKCKDVVEKYSKEIGYYLELIMRKGYVDLAKEVLKEYNIHYKSKESEKPDGVRISEELVKESLNAGDEEFSIELIEQGEDLIKNCGIGILVKACDLKRRGVVKYILERPDCPDINSLYRENLVTTGDVHIDIKRTIFDYACTSGDIEIVRSFVDKKGATFNDIDDTRKKSILHEIDSVKTREYVKRLRDGIEDKKKQDIIEEIGKRRNRLDKFKDLFSK